MMTAATLTGGCSCGAVRYTLSEAPLAVAACHCTRCRRQSGAAFSVNLVVRPAALAIEGDLASWADPDTESGQPVSRDHCGRCGSPIRSVPAASPGIVVVKAGSLDEPGEFAPTTHYWTESKLPWVVIPEGQPAFARGPKS